MTEKELLQNALEEKLLTAEKRIAILRLLLSVFNAFVYLTFWKEDGYSNFALAVIGFALIYSSVTLGFELYKKLRFLRNVYFTTIGDGLLIATWISATGYMDSPFYVLWYVSIIAVAMRYSLLEIAISALAYLLLYLGVFLIDPASNIDLSDLLVRVGYIPLAAMLGMYISIEIADQIDGKIKIIQGELALKEAHGRLEEKVLERTEQLSIINKDLMDSMNYAKRIQEAILPSDNTFREAFTESFVISIARDVISGDFYWVQRTENATYFAVVDCTGHGVPGALMSMIANSLLNRTIIENNVIDPGKALKKMDVALAQLVKNNHTEDSVNDGMDLIIGSIDSENVLHYASAYGHGLIIRNGEAIELKTTKFSVGGLLTSDEKYFNTYSMQLKNGDTLYCYSDGFQDQFGGKRGKKFLRKNLIELLLTESCRPITTQQHNILAAFNSWKGTEPQTDDVTVIGIRI